MLRGKYALVTGGSRGIGFAIAKELYESGCAVVITGRKEETLREAAEKIGNGVKYLVWDMADIESYEKNIALAVMTADCLPVLLRSIDGDVVAAVHCGWKGLASNVLENTILAMNCERNKIMAWLGPCIGEKCFEVGKEVKQIFEDKNLALGQFFKQTDEVHYLADLKCIAKFILNQLNVYNVSVNEECTYSNVDKYYSYRKEKITGRMAGVIWI
jgi:YfiH family protein